MPCPNDFCPGGRNGGCATCHGGWCEEHAERYEECPCDVLDPADACSEALSNAKRALVGLENCIKAGSPTQVLLRFAGDVMSALADADENFLPALAAAAEDDD